MDVEEGAFLARAVLWFPALSVLLAAPTGSAAPQSARPEGQPGEAIVCQRDETTVGFFDIERRCLPRFNGIAARSGDVLRIVLRNGITKAFKDASVSCEESKDPNACVSFTLKGYHPQNDAVVVDRWLRPGRRRSISGPT